MKPSNFRKVQINFIRDYDEHIIDSIYYSAISSQKDLENKLSERAKKIETSTVLTDDEKHFEMEFLSDEHYESKLIKELSEEMVIIALFKTVEISIKKMLQCSQLFTEDELHQFFRIKALMRHVREKIVDLKTLEGLSSYDELRCINNSIKHKGTVGNELAEFNGWTEGEKIINLWSHYERLKPGVRNFVYKLSDKIVSKLDI